MGKRDIRGTLKSDLKSWMKGGQKGIPAFFPGGDFSGYGGRKKATPEIEDPPLPPTDGTGDGSGGGGISTASVPKTWPAIVDHFFPNGGTGYKDGGLVRGGGRAQKGRGRGKIV